MKKFFIIVLSMYSCINYADSLTDLLVIKEPQPNKMFYSLLPKASDDNPDMNFIKSKESLSNCLEENYLSMLEKTFTAKRFIATKTNLENSSKAALFFEVDTIEPTKEFFDKAKKRFTKTKNIHLHQGDAVKILPNLLQDEEQAIIFLNSPADKSKNTTIISELDAIKQSGISNAILILDTLCRYDTPKHPALNQIIEKIMTINKTYKCAVIYDTLIAFPADENIFVSPVVRATTISRLYDGQNYLIEDVLLAELALAHAKDAEKEFLAELAEPNEDLEESLASPHYALWGGLILLEQEEYTKAHKYLLEAKKRGITGWRIDWYLAMAEAQCFFDVR